MTVTKYMWDPDFDTVMKEEDEFGVTTAKYDYEPVEFGRLISQNRDGETSYYHYDGLGSATALTDINGDVTDTYEYDAWGNATATTGSKVNPYRWVGELGYYFENDTEDYYVRARLYDPMVARWCSTDPIRSTDGLNPYLYVQNWVIALVDPSGSVIFDPSNPDGPRHMPKRLPWQLFYKALVDASLDCSVDGAKCRCANADDGCRFYIFLSGRKRIDGVFSIQLTFESHPAKVHPLRPSGRPIPIDSDLCFGDFGRAAGGSITVDFLREKCVYTSEHFSDPGGQPNETIPKECKGVSVRPLVDRRQDGANRFLINHGTVWEFTRAVRSITFKFDIELFCGCGGADDLGRPNGRNTKVVHVEGSVG